MHETFEVIEPFLAEHGISIKAKWAWSGTDHEFNANHCVWEYGNVRGTLRLRDNIITLQTVDSWPYNLGDPTVQVDLHKPDSLEKLVEAIKHGHTGLRKINRVAP